MSGDELDFDNPPPEDSGKPRERSERSKRRDNARARERQGDVGRRLGTIFERLAQSVEGRGDEELAEMIREDREAMVGGLVNLTSKAPGLAPGVMAVLAVLEPLIAFGRIFRLLLRRTGDRRAERLAAWEAEQSGRPVPAPMPEGFEPPEEDWGVRPAPLPGQRVEEVEDDAVARPWLLP